MSSSKSTCKRKKRDSDSDCDLAADQSRWRTPRAQQAYSSKLLDALRLVRAGGGGGGGATTSTSTSTITSRQVRDAAYRALAVAARGRSRWSRAILARRRRALHLQRARLPTGSGQSLVASKARALGRLVPGCRSLSLPALLAEVSDYIAALQMQVRAMNKLTQDLASS